jgi:molybdenum cofactor cytidylyltransferase
MTKVAGLLLAAGSSSRMGRPKQLLPFGEQSLIEHAVKEALRSDLHRLHIVLGCRAEEIRDSIGPDLDGRRVQVIENPRYAEGISTSILSGMQVIEREYDHALILLGDMPWITAELINQLIREYLKSGMSLGAVKKMEQRTLPVIVGRKFFPHLHQLQGDVGARELFLRFPREVCLVEADNPYEDTDIDTPEDYEAARLLWEAGTPKPPPARRR